METPVDLLPYLLVIGAFFMAMKCYMNRHRTYKSFLHHVMLYEMEQYGEHRGNRVVPFLSLRLFVTNQRKIPARERPHVSDEEGRRLLVAQ
ncbi:hypothetical protein GGR02_000096 [Anoxybacillus voinovskiensis]|uniref:Uncharacterized protein n=1 Tax=Anoxybacteroides voinovskiense TaxID=230470 RepID=A0A840DHY8_9BACL|nr:hypothetical protein [Anoxybacillus voinovskiensis]MBB4072350.1 hypothetical protein [Anoxybacillus voinovskiensis]GGJ58555.1 hypothetical protein GCM10008982_04600 [Anoxybacillus voinovskiensis]